MASAAVDLSRVGLVPPLSLFLGLGADPGWVGVGPSSLLISVWQADRRRRGRSVPQCACPSLSRPGSPPPPSFLSFQYRDKRAKSCYWSLSKALLVAPLALALALALAPLQHLILRIPSEKPSFRYAPSTFFASKIANRRFAAIRENRLNVLKIVFCLRLDSRESPPFKESTLTYSHYA